MPFVFVGHISVKEKQGQTCKTKKSGAHHHRNGILFVMSGQRGGIGNEGHKHQMHKVQPKCHFCAFLEMLENLEIPHPQ